MRQISFSLEARISKLRAARSRRCRQWKGAASEPRRPRSAETPTSLGKGYRPTTRSAENHFTLKIMQTEYKCSRNEFGAWV